MDLNKSFDIYIKYLTYEKNLSVNSVNSYKRDIEQFMDFIKKDKCAKADVIDKFNKNDKKINYGELNLNSFRKFVKYLDSFGYSNNTVIRKYASLTNFFKFLENNDFLKNPLSQHIMPPKKHHRLYSFLSMSEVDKLLESINISCAKDVRDRAIIEFMYSTGARVSEVENICIEDIDIEKSEARVFGKGRKYRTVYLNSEAVFWIKEYIKKRNEFLYSSRSGSYNYNGSKNLKAESHVFLNRFGKKLSARGIRNIVKKYMEISKIDKKISPHDIRHTFATHMLQEGAGIREIQELLGHENISTTQIYTHLNIKKIKEDYRKYHPRAKQ